MPTLMPVYSPLPLRAVLSGLRAMISARYAANARAQVEEWLAHGGPTQSVLLVDSGTSALTLALTSTARASDRPVAIPAYACYDIATAVDGARVPFLFYDVDPETLGPDFASLRRALEAGADRVVVAHLYGVPVNLDAVFGLAKEFDALVIEDAAQGIGATWRGVALGYHGSLGVFSFGRGKGITGGSGGALVGNDERGRAAVSSSRPSVRSATRSLREIVTLLAQWVFARRSLFWIPSAVPYAGLGDTPYHSPHPVSAASALSVGVLAVTSKGQGSSVTVRRSNASRLTSLSDRADLSGVTVAPSGIAGYLRLPLLTRSVAQSHADASRPLGIMRAYPTALADLPGFGCRAAGEEGVPGARALADRLVTVPTHEALAEDDLQLLHGWLFAR